MGRKREADEEHMLIHRDNPEGRGRAASQLVTGTVDEKQSEQQMALIEWNCKEGVGGGGTVRQGSLSHLSASHGTSNPVPPSPPAPLNFSSDNATLLPPAWPLAF